MLCYAVCAYGRKNCGGYSSHNFCTGICPVLSRQQYSYLFKNEDEKMKPASTTKIMTSLITLEEAASCNSEVTFKQEMVAEGSSMYLKVGEKSDFRTLRQE